MEFFAADHLGDAIARLYERYAELLPDGPARDARRGDGALASRPARAFDRIRTSTLALASPRVEFIDHRTLGFPSGRGRRGIARETSVRCSSSPTTSRFRIDDVLRLEPGALLLR